MDGNQLTTAALVASVVFGLAIALLAVTGAEALGTVAGVGGVLLGAMWAIIAVTRRRGGGRSL